MRIVTLSDTHGLHHKVHIPDGDVLVHAGDFMNFGTRVQEATDFLSWFAGHPHSEKILVAGNHDILFEQDPSWANSLIPPGVQYLKNSGTTIHGIRFWGSPFTPRFMEWAFMADPGEPIAHIWSQIPGKTDVLITHGPPLGILDEMDEPKQRVGCEELRKAVDRIKPRYHIFGHIHAGYGVEMPEESETLFVNAAVCNEQYRPINQPIVIDV
jgi:Icc-related predicted phosphoesterase